MLSAVRRTDNKLLAYARSAYGTVDLSEEDWIKCEDHYKVNTFSNLLSEPINFFSAIKIFQEE
jgi:hypothetical protein